MKSEDVNRYTSIPQRHQNVQHRVKKERKKRLRLQSDCAIDPTDRRTETFGEIYRLAEHTEIDRIYGI